MAKKEPKIKSNQELAYEVQKFLARLSIDLSFVNEVFLISHNMNENETMYRASRLGYFIIEGKIKEIKNHSNYLTEEILTKNNLKLKINFKDEDFQNLKKALKKEVVAIDANGIDFIDKEGNSKRYCFHYILGDIKHEILEKYDTIVGKLNGNFESRVIDKKRTLKIRDSQTEKVIIEIPRNFLVGIAECNSIEFRYARDNDTNICELKYPTNIGEQSIYFRTIL